MQHCASQVHCFYNGIVCAAIIRRKTSHLEGWQPLFSVVRHHISQHNVRVCVCVCVRAWNPHVPPICRRSHDVRVITAALRAGFFCHRPHGGTEHHMRCSSQPDAACVCQKEKRGKKRPRPPKLCTINHCVKGQRGNKKKMWCWLQHCIDSPATPVWL